MLTGGSTEIVNSSGDLTLRCPLDPEEGLVASSPEFIERERWWFEPDPCDLAPAEADLLRGSGVVRLVGRGLGGPLGGDSD